MGVRARVLLLVPVVGLGFVPSAPQAADPASVPPAPSAKATAGRVYADQVAPFVTKYCVSCHGPTKQSGGLALHTYADAKAVIKDRDVWENVVQRLQNGEMPPKKKAQPTQAERDAVVAWLQGELSTSVCTDPPNPGRVTMRRLNRAEYNNTVRDLLGVDFHPADNFPDDDVGYGFDNIGDVLSLSPLLLEKYLTAADDVVAKAFAPEMETPTARLADAFTLRSTSRTEFVRDDGRRLFDGELYTTFTFPRDGEYVL